MGGFRFQLGSVHKPSARIKLTSETTCFKMSSILFTLPHTTSWCILQRPLRTVVPTFMFTFPTRLSLMTVVARGRLVTMHTSWISILQKICSPVTVPCIIIIFRSHLFYQRNLSNNLEKRCKLSTTRVLSPMLSDKVKKDLLLDFNSYFK